MGRVVMCVFAVLCAAPAMASPRDDAFDQQIKGELAAIDPTAVESFQRANELRDKDPAGAEKLYAQVELKAPRFDHVFRRHGWVLARLGRSTDAMPLLKHALELNDSAINQASVATGLMMWAGDAQETQDEVWSLTSKAVVNAPDDPFVEMAYAQAALLTSHEREFRFATARALSLAPDDPQALYLGSILSATDGSWSEAFDRLERAHAGGGLSDDHYRKLRAKFEENRPFWYAWARPVGWALAAWMLGLVALLMVGLVLSAATLRACRRPVIARDGHVRGIDARLRRVYASVLWLCGAYFYVSMPLTVVAVVAVATAVFLAMAAAGAVFFKVVILLGLVVIGTVIASLRCFFVRVKDEAPGDKLDLARHPRLRAVLEEVAARIGTRPVDAVYLVPGTDVAVIERGGAMKQLRGESERCLILGVAVLREFPLSAFQAVLAHEYGHFVNRDTAGGRFALVVRHSLHAFANALVRAGAAGWYSPSWWFVVAYERIFLRISHGASRLQEVLADRWAATAYGAEAFEAGLRHVIAAEARFDAHVQAMINEKLPVGRLYRMVREADGQVMSSATEVRFGRSASAYDSHPPPAVRVAWVRSLPLDGRATASLPADAWSLFEEREAIERAMAELIRTRAAQRGVQLPIEEVAPSAA